MFALAVGERYCERLVTSGDHPRVLQSLQVQSAWPALLFGQKPLTIHRSTYQIPTPKTPRAELRVELAGNQADNQQEGGLRSKPQVLLGYPYRQFFY